MQTGRIARVEELTRMPSDVQDALITVLSEKTLPIAELNHEVQARKGFNIVATANSRDRGVNELSSALKRRFNTVTLPVPATLEEESRIVETRVAALGRALDLPVEPPALEEIRRVVTIFRELRVGRNRGRQGQTQGSQRHAVAGGGDLGHHQRSDARGALWRRCPDRRRHRGRSGRHGRPGPGARHHRVQRVSRDRGSRARGLG